MPVRFLLLATTTCLVIVGSVHGQTVVPDVDTDFPVSIDETGVIGRGPFRFEPEDLTHPGGTGVVERHAVPAAGLQDPMPGDEFWSDAFGGTLGFNRDVTDVVVAGGEIFVTGDFSFLDYDHTEFVPNLMRWTGSGWEHLGLRVQAMAVYDSRLYALGSEIVFESSEPTRAVVRWTEDGWETVASHLCASGHVMAVGPGGVYLGKTGSGSQCPSTLFHWNGSEWNTMGGVRGAVYSIAVHGDDVYVGGQLTEAGGTPVNNVARWNGESWEALGEGVDDWGVRAIASFDGGVYVGGSFSQAGGQPAGMIAKWDGERWEPLGDGLKWGEITTVGVRAIAVRGSEIYAGGAFWQAGDSLVPGLARWDGHAWSRVGRGAGGYVPHAIAVDGERLLIASGNKVHELESGVWRSLEPPNDGLNDVVRAIAASGNDMYVGGRFTTAGGRWVNYVARWDGANWHTLGDGVDGTVTTIAIRGSDVFVGGYFRHAGGKLVNGIARWDGKEWHPLGLGFRLRTRAEPGNHGVVYALALDGSDLYAGGRFGLAGDVTTSAIARWDGSDWAGMGPGLVWERSDGYLEEARVFALAVIDGKVHAGGYFRLPDDDRTGVVAVWVNEDWKSMREGLASSTARGFVEYDGAVYAVGNFELREQISGEPSGSILVRWDGTEWRPVLRTGSGNYGYALATHGSNLYLGGRLEYLENATGMHWTEHQGIVTWDGSNWRGFGRGLGRRGSIVWGGNVFAMAVTDAHVYVGGDFLSAGGRRSNYFARWTAPSNVSTETLPPDPPAGASALSIYPNPVHTTATISVDLAASGHIRGEVYDALGRRVRTLVDSYFPAGTHSIHLNTGGLAPGHYYVRLVGTDQTSTQAIVVLK